jgi:hypothetical protein
MSRGPFVSALVRKKTLYIASSAYAGNGIPLYLDPVKIVFPVIENSVKSLISAEMTVEPPRIELDTRNSKLGDCFMRAAKVKSRREFAKGTVNFCLGKGRDGNYACDLTENILSAEDGISTRFHDLDDAINFLVEKICKYANSQEAP